MPRMRRFLRATLAALALPFFTASAVAQCAMCRASLLSSRGGADLIEGLRQGIVLLLVIPLLIAATLLIRWKHAARTGRPSAMDLSPGSPEGAVDFSPGRKPWVVIGKSAQAPEGRQKAPPLARYIEP